MNFETPLIEGRFLRRYKRFFADVDIGGTTVVAHVPNTGSLLGCLEPGAAAGLTQSTNPKRKLGYTLELLRVGTTWIGVNPIRANRLVEEAIAGGVVKELRGYGTVRREVPYGKSSRIDLLLEQSGKPSCYVEVKSVTLGRPPVALFPDAVSTRAAKHMAELTREVASGARACVVFAVQREDCERFTPADEIDPAYGRALRAAANAGVEVLAYRARVSRADIAIERKLPVVL